uniref:Uncharacterized protein n=1 Tax=Rhizophora mucronata TaxID=61149 RepID=A0A2P2III8_RHIMU
MRKIICFLIKLLLIMYSLHHLRPLHSALHRRKIHASQHIQLGQP